MHLFTRRLPQYPDEPQSHDKYQELCTSTSCGLSLLFLIKHILAPWHLTWHSAQLIKRFVKIQHQKRYLESATFRDNWLLDVFSFDELGPGFVISISTALCPIYICKFEFSFPNSNNFLGRRPLRMIHVNLSSKAACHDILKWLAYKNGDDINMQYIKTPIRCGLCLRSICNELSFKIYCCRGPSLLYSCHPSRVSDEKLSLGICPVISSNFLLRC